MAFDDYAMSHPLNTGTQETAHIAMETWCPECSGPPQNERAMVAYCQIHMPNTQGEADRLLEPSSHIFYGDAGGDDNRLTCDFIHRRS